MTKQKKKLRKFSYFNNGNLPLTDETKYLSSINQSYNSPMRYHQVMQYFEDEQGICRIVQRDSNNEQDDKYYIAKERRDGSDEEWYEIEEWVKGYAVVKYQEIRVHQVKVDLLLIQ